MKNVLVFDFFLALEQKKNIIYSSCLNKIYKFKKNQIIIEIFWNKYLYITYLFEILNRTISLFNKKIKISFDWMLFKFYRIYKLRNIYSLTKLCFYLVWKNKTFNFYHYFMYHKQLHFKEIFGGTKNLNFSINSANFVFLNWKLHN